MHTHPLTVHHTGRFLALASRAVHRAFGRSRPAVASVLVPRHAPPPSRHELPAAARERADRTRAQLPARRPDDVRLPGLCTELPEQPRAALVQRTGEDDQPQSARPSSTSRATRRSSVAHGAICPSSLSVRYFFIMTDRNPC